jgi:NarL family two-component system response regulator LiaR
MTNPENEGGITTMTASYPIRVLIVDDHSMVRRGLMAYLRAERDLEMVGEAGDGEEALAMCEATAPDVVLMDLVMPRMDGVEATRTIRRRWPETQVIALTSFQEAEYVRDALQAGAIGYLLKNISGEDLADAIRSAHAGRSTLAPEAVKALVKPVQADPLSPGYDLTPREREVLGLLAEGLTNAQIAQRLAVSHATIKAHVSNILSKLGVSNRGEAVAIAIKHNLC